MSFAPGLSSEIREDTRKFKWVSFYEDEVCLSVYCGEEAAERVACPQPGANSDFVGTVVDLFFDVLKFYDAVK
jgi:hypothetical protein